MPLPLTSPRVLAAAAATLALMGGAANLAFADQTLAAADPASPAPMAAPMAGADHGPRGGAGMMGFGGPREMRQLLDAVNATEAQRTQIRQLMQGAEPDMRAQHEAARALHDEQLKVLTQATIDPAAAEALRQKMLTQHDQASKRQLALMLDVSRVLTPEQRAKVATQLAQDHRRPEHGPGAERHRQPPQGAPKPVS